ncbi:hypothetical protein TVAG_568670 [Trichomonas vaginalis G3]|uniref:Uncharacterized protein n=3 Tax=Trichomonas vaginalis (strain ATCC PRA-98 / G3) TaxID=412133 RepID=A2GQC3_TRIV3|nr:hypothetical protein TVAG_568670 [Trichomonas vaginalis G3]|eukprot:XP_001293574.1 hypothetical protein [Trichomonas vaginalis G3]
MEYSYESYSYLSDNKQNDSIPSYTTIGTSTVQDTAEQITNFQNEILNQAKLIDSYISNINKRDSNTEIFHRLQDLFKLFKAELNLNFSIRKVLIQERSTNEKLTSTCISSYTQLNEFFSKLSSITGIEIKSLDDTINVIDNAVKNGLFSNKKRLLHRNRKLRQKLLDIQSQYEKCQAQHSLEIAEMQAKIENAANTEFELLELRKIHNEDAETIKSLVMQKKNEVEQLSMQIKSQQYSKMNDYYEIKRKNESLVQEIASMKNELQSIKSKLDTTIKERDDLISKLKNNESNQNQIKNLEQELLQKEEENIRLRRERKALTRCVNESKTTKQVYIDKIDELQRKLLIIENKAKKKNISNDEEYKNLQCSLANAINKIKRLENENSRLTSDSSYTGESEMIIKAFHDLKYALQLDDRASPQEVVKYIVSALNNQKDSTDFIMNDNESVSRCSSFTSAPVSYEKYCGNALQEEIDALQREVINLNGEVIKYSK